VPAGPAGPGRPGGPAGPTPPPAPSGPAAVELSAGVKDGDQVILDRPVELTDGHKVQISNDHPLVVSVGAPGGWP
jgi:hypothetical protein